MVLRFNPNIIRTNANSPNISSLPFFNSPPVIPAIFFPLEDEKYPFCFGEQSIMFSQNATVRGP